SPPRSPRPSTAAIYGDFVGERPSTPLALGLPARAALTAAYAMEPVHQSDDQPHGKDPNQQRSQHVSKDAARRPNPGPRAAQPGPKNPEHELAEEHRQRQDDNELQRPIEHRRHLPSSSVSSSAEGLVIGISTVLFTSLPQTSQPGVRVRAN